MFMRMRRRLGMLGRRTMITNMEDKMKNTEGKSTIVSRTKKMGEYYIFKNTLNFFSH